MGLSELFAAEAAMYRRSLAFVQTNPTATGCFEVIEVSLDVLLSTAVIPQDAEDARTVAAISGRVTNTTAGCLREALHGYVQNSFALMRDLVETQTLLDYFSHDATKIAVWRVADERTRKEVFGHGRMGIALDRRDGFTSGKRARDYKNFCAYGTHVTYPGLMLIASDNGTVSPGPLWRERYFTNCLYELANRTMFCTVTLVPLLSNDTPDDPAEAARLATQVARLRQMVIPPESGECQPSPRADS